MEPSLLAAVHPRLIPDVIEMAVAMQANLYQLKVVQSQRMDIPESRHEIRTPRPKAVTRFKEILITDEMLAGYDIPALVLRIHEIWGQHCLFCWFFGVQDPHRPPDFKRFDDAQEVRCPSAVAVKTQEVEGSLWRLRFEQRLRSDAGFRDAPGFGQAYQTALEIPVLVMGETVRTCGKENLLLGTCEFAGMVAAARWIADDRWGWAQEGIMELPAFMPV